MSVILTKRNLARAQRKPTAATAGLEGNLSELDRFPDAPSAAAEEPKPDDSLARILKLIPGEATALYTAALALAPESVALPIVAFVLCVVVVVLVIARSGKSNDPPVVPEPMQFVFQLLAFTAWAFSIHSPLSPFFTIPTWIPALAILFVPVLGGLLLGDKEATPAAATAGAGR